MLSRLDRLAYRSQHLSFLINATVMQEAARLVTRTPRPYVSQPELRALMRASASPSPQIARALGLDRALAPQAASRNRL